MKKDNIRSYIVIALIVIVFSVIAFAVPFAKTGAFVIAYIFGLISIGVQVYTVKISLLNNASAKSRFYGFPIVKIGVAYLVSQLVLSIVEMALAAIMPVWIPIVLNVILFAVAAIGCISAETMRDEITHQDEKLKKSVSAMRNLQSKAAVLPRECNDNELKTMLSELSEAFRFSDPVSNSETELAEKELENLLAEIQNAVIDNDIPSATELCKKASSVLVERNSVCALNK